MRMGSKSSKYHDKRGGRGGILTEPRTGIALFLLLTTGISGKKVTSIQKTNREYHISFRLCECQGYKRLTKRPLIALATHLTLEEPPRRLEYQISLHRCQPLELRCDSVEYTRVERRAIGYVGWIQREELGDF